MKHAKKAFLASLLSVVLCVTMLVGTTYAWFTDSVTSAGNIIKAGTLDIDFAWANGTEDPSTATYKDASEGPMFMYELWEPGYADVKHIAIKNIGTLALKYQIRIVANGTVSALADAIDVYYVDPATQITSRDMLTDAYKLGSLTQVLAGMSSTTNSASGVLVPVGQEGNGFKSAEYLTIALKMRESAGNEYQGLSLGTTFSVQLLATQYTFEEDSFDNLYDEIADGTPDYPVWPKRFESQTAEVVENQPVTIVANVVPNTEAVGKTTTVEFPANALDEGNLELTVETEDVPPASQFSITNETATVATIDLSAILDDEAVTSFKGEYVTVTTYIAPGLDSEKLALIYTGSATGHEIISYNSETGEFKFRTNHFSEFHVTSTEVVAYNLGNGDFYTSLQDAFTAGGELLLIRSVEQETNSNYEVPATSIVVLDLNGYSISTLAPDAGKAYTIINKGTLTIKDNTDVNKDGSGKGALTSSAVNPDMQDVPGYASNTITNHGKLTVESGLIENKGAGYACFAIDNVTNGNYYTPELIINGGKMLQESAYHYAVRMFCNSTTKANKVVVNGGIISGGYAFWLQTPNGNANKAELVINGGTFEARDGYAIFTGGSGSTNDTRNYTNTSILITGGVLNRVGLGGVSSNERTLQSFEITGGTFTELSYGANIVPIISENVSIPGVQ